MSELDDGFAVLEDGLNAPGFGVVDGVVGATGFDVAGPAVGPEDAAVVFDTRLGGLIETPFGALIGPPPFIVVTFFGEFFGGELARL